MDKPAPTEQHGTVRNQFSRRAFLRRTTAATGGILVLGNARHAFAYEANSKLNVAAIGIAGQGKSNLDNIAALGENIVALCDVDEAYAAESFQKYPVARRYKDFRRLYDELGKEIDAVVVSTPDHTHAVAAAAAMRMGKHVYCEKPLTRTVHEARVLRELAQEHQVATQLGNQGSAEPGLRRAVELVWAGAIGDVRDVHVWLAGGNRPQKIPKDTPAVPETLAWDLWLGPAPERRYHPEYLPAKWRGWRAFGSGIIGDFGCHTGNLMFRALRLHELWTAQPPMDPGKPGSNFIKVEGKPSERDQEGYPKSMITNLRFPRRGNQPAFRLKLYAKETPPEDLMPGHPRGPWGDLLVGTKGSIYSDCPWNTRYALLPREKFQDKKHLPPETLPRSNGHHREWVDACKGHGKTFSGFEIGGPLTELMQLINVASLVEGPFEYDPLTGKVLNSDKANELLHRPYRQGWTL
jgi:hypothetical protein